MNAHLPDIPGALVLLVECRLVNFAVEDVRKIATLTDAASEESSMKNTYKTVVIFSSLSNL